jgi:hypothetical protein
MPTRTPRKKHRSQVGPLLPDNHSAPTPSDIPAGVSVPVL